MADLINRPRELGSNQDTGCAALTSFAPDSLSIEVIKFNYEFP